MPTSRSPRHYSNLDQYMLSISEALSFACDNGVSSCIIYMCVVIRDCHLEFCVCVFIVKSSVPINLLANIVNVCVGDIHLHSPFQKYSEIYASVTSWVCYCLQAMMGL